MFGMTEQGPTIKVHCGSNLVFFCSPQPKDSGSGGATVLVSSLKEAQVQVNQFLTELVERSGSAHSNEETDGGEDEASDEEDEEADEDGSCSMVSEAVKRKLEGNDSHSNTSKTEGKRTKSQS